MRRYLGLSSDTDNTPTNPKKLDKGNKIETKKTYCQRIRKGGITDITSKPNIYSQIRNSQVNCGCSNGPCIRVCHVIGIEQSIIQYMD